LAIPIYNDPEEQASAQLEALYTTISHISCASHPAVVVVVVGAAVVVVVAGQEF
jgi:hypothetical protein